MVAFAPASGRATVRFNSLGVQIGGGWNLVSGPPLPSVPDEPTWWATVPVVVDRSNVTDLAVSLQQGQAVTGSIVFEGKSVPPPPDRLVRGLIALVPSARGSRQTVPGRIDSDGRFALPGMPPGE